MRVIIALLLMLVVAPAAAQTSPAAPAAVVKADAALTARIDELPGVLAGGGDFDGYFNPAFRAAVSKDKWTALTAQISGELGKPLSIDSVKPATPLSAYVRVRYERGILNLQIAVDGAAPHQIVGLLLTGTEVAGDSLDKLTADFRALPGGSGFGLYALGAGAPRLVAGLNAERPAPLGSAFKLWVLGELVRETAAGERKWGDVVPVGTASLPSGMTQAWPKGSPTTLQTLALLMISISDNTATDTLVTLEGTKLDGFVAKAGAPGLAPMLTTRQMFAIKAAGNADLAAKWAAATSPAARRKLLTDNEAKLAATPVDASMFADNKPLAIDTLEWFASPAQTAAMLDWFRTTGGEPALSILAVNPGIDPTTRAKFDYVGFKGGSEPGVITLNLLVRRKDGRWLALAANWHRADAAVDTNTFLKLVTRALALAGDAKLD